MRQQTVDAIELLLADLHIRLLLADIWYEVVITDFSGGALELFERACDDKPK